MRPVQRSLASSLAGRHNHRRASSSVFDHGGGATPTVLDRIMT
jgi:hypothetical protein